MAQRRHGIDGRAWKMPLHPACSSSLPVRGRRSSGRAAAVGPRGIAWKSLHAVSAGMGQEWVSSLWPESGFWSPRHPLFRPWTFQPLEMPRHGGTFVPGWSESLGLWQHPPYGSWSRRGLHIRLRLVLQHIWATVQCTCGAKVRNTAPVLCGMLWRVPRRKEDLPSISLQSHGQ